MAKVVSYDLWDMYSFDLSWFRSNLSLESVITGKAVQFNGRTYNDELLLRASDEYFDLELSAMGAGLSQSPSGQIASGVINAISEKVYLTKNLTWYAEGLNASATALYEIAGTYSTRDDFTFLMSFLDGDDTIILSSFADRMSGFAGDDKITGGLGEDYLEGGGGNDTFVDTKAGLNGDRIADFGIGDRIIFTDATIATFAFSLSGSTLTYTGGVLTFGWGPAARMVASASVTGGVVLNLVDQFDNPSSLLVNNFLNSAGWTGQDRFPRHIADVNGDGHSDIVGFGHAGVVVSFGSAAGGFSAAGLMIANFGQASGWTSDNQFHRELADVDGDGRADIVGFGMAGTLVSFAKSDGTFSDPVTGMLNFGTKQGWSTQDGFARKLGDVNGDGKADLVGFTDAGTLVSLGNGDGTFEDAKLAFSDFGVQQGWTSDNSFHRAVADVNGDGADDIIGFGYDGTLVALSKGDGTFDAPKLALGNFGKDQGWSSQDSFTRDAADVNGDGYADLVGFGIGGTFVAYGQADGSFTQARLDVSNFGPNQGWTTDSSYHRELADINNDGTIDIVGFGAADVLAGYNQGHWLL